MNVAKKSSRSRNIQTSEKQVSRPPKPHYTNRAHLYYHEEVAPIEKSYRQAMRIGNYSEAVKLFEALQVAKKEHQILLSRNERVRVK